MDLVNYTSNNSQVIELEANPKTPKRREKVIVFGKDDNDLWEAMIEIERKKLPSSIFFKQCATYVLKEIKAGRNPLL